MKLKKLLISASAIAAGSGLLATVLTSCAKANVDEKLKVSLDDSGLLYKTGNLGDKYKLSFSDAIKLALTRSNSWGQFKTALADEIVYQWYLDRAATDKSSDKKNASFRENIDEWNYQINKDYDSTVQTCKNKYGANWEFYLQNEYLAPLGGTEAAYKHAKLVDKVKADFVSKVFAKSYFGYKTETTTKAPSKYEHIFIKASKDVNKNTLRNPENWGNLGFFARADLSFPIADADVPTSYDAIDPSFLAKHPEGDYAAIQDYVFNRWFTTEKPFFAVASLFKYSAPKYVAGGKLDQIYNSTYTGVKLPDKPNEAFPFFGAGDDGSTRKFVDFLTDMGKYKFATRYIDNNGAEKASNGTITIPTSDTDDSQTLLLVCGNQMFTSLYTPYAMTMGNLYSQMMGELDGTSNPNHLSAGDTETAGTVIYNIINGYKHGVNDDFAILSNFFYAADDDKTGIPTTMTSLLDLNNVYGGRVSAAEYHCPLFAQCKDYDYFYGKEGGIGLRYITNNIQVDDFKFSSDEEEQPWVMELNEAGVHVQTIDGYARIAELPTTQEKQAELKKLVMYRLMQKQTNDEAAASISTDLLGESGKLKTYFNDNFADIVIELAAMNEEDTLKNSKYNIFRKIDTYKEDFSSKEKAKLQEDLFLYGIMTDQKLCQAFDTISAYLGSLIGYETVKKIFSTLETANNKIYSYRSKQISNSKSQESFSKTIFENGLLAPFVYKPSQSVGLNSTYDYNTVNRVISLGYKTQVETDGYFKTMKTLQAAIDESAFVKEVIENAKVGGSTGFAPQISTAKNASSNRFWYQSAIVDKLMYSVMGNKAFTANAIKKNTYDYYIDKMNGSEWFGDASSKIWGQESATGAFATTYAKSKLITGDKTLASYMMGPTNVTLADYYSTMISQLELLRQKDENENGAYSDNQLNYALLKATVMYLVSNDFENFYTLYNSKINDDEAAIVGYMAKGYTSESAHTLSEEGLETFSTEKTDYDFTVDVDNIWDKIGYSGDYRSNEETSSKLSSTSQWTAINKKINVDGTSEVTKPMSGFLGIQTKSSNQLDSGSGLQTAVFDKFSKATYLSRDLNKSDTSAKYSQNTGCWFKFAGSKTADLKDITFSFTYDGTTVTADTWFTGDYAPVRKVAKKIVEYRTMDDLRTLAKTLADSYDGYSEFSGIAEGTTVCQSADDMKMKMLKLLPSVESAKHKTEWKAHDINTFQRVSNAEAHTVEVNPSYAFKDSKAKTAHKLLLTQINKADITEHALAPTWDGTKWVQGNSPITPEEFWVILFNFASESTVQQRVITEAVKAAFGDEKLIVYDAQLYNQFDTVWVKDWTKKTMGA